MPKIVRTIATDVPIERAFGYLADFSNNQEWDPGTESSVPRTSDGPGVGQSYDLIVMWGDRKLPMVYEVTDYQLNELITLVGDGSTTHAVDTMKFTALPSGGTEVTYIADIRLKGFLRAAEPFLGGKFKELGDHAEAGMAAALDRLASSDGD